MCTVSCLAFGARTLQREHIEGRRVLEVGARDVNGSLRSIFGFYEPEAYVGVDIEAGPGVDVICDATDLVERFGEESFDVVIATEVLEHVRHWRPAVNNIKAVCKHEGRLLVTTRSRGFPVHGFPHDYWRYEVEDFQSIFGDLELTDLERDPTAPGVFLHAEKPAEFTAVDLSGIDLFSIVTNRRTSELAPEDFRSMSWYLRAAGWTSFKLARRAGMALFPGRLSPE
jgi:SAM-dependent methyltransferase